MNTNRCPFFILVFSLFAGWFSSAALGQSPGGFVIRGEVPEAKYGHVYLFGVDDRKKPLAEAEIDDHRFVLSGHIDDPRQCLLQVNTQGVYFFLDNASMTLHARSGWNTGDIKGSVSNDVYDTLFAWKNAWGDRASEPNGTGIVALVDSFARVFPRSAVPAFALYLFGGDRLENLRRIYADLGPVARMSYYGKIMKGRITDMAGSALGSPLPEFSFSTPGGVILTKDSLKGAISVVDFWASWCGPCRAEIPYLKAIYRDYKARGVRFLSISMDANAGNWLKADKEEQLPWNSVRDTAGFGRSDLQKALGFAHIPFILVVDRAGRIQAKDIRRQPLRDELDRLLTP